MEKNRRIAKAYARRHSLTINGSENEYLDGTVLGLNAFDNPDQTSKSQYARRYIGQGIRIKICPNGDILAKRLSKADVFWHQLVARKHDELEPLDDFYGLKSSDYSDAYGKQPARNGHSNSKATNNNNNNNNLAPVSSAGSSSSSSGIVVSSASYGLAASAKGKLDKAPKRAYKSLALEFGKPVKIFDMQKFKQILQFEAGRPLPNKSRLERLCIAVVGFVMDDNSVLNLPSWIMVINIVAIDLLKNALSLAMSASGQLASEQAHSERPYASRFLREHNISSRNFNDRAVEQEPFVGLEDNFGIASARALSRVAKSSQIAASKKAFAAAAASGAYNRTGPATSIATGGGGFKMQQNIDGDDNNKRDFNRIGGSSGFDSNCSTQKTDRSASNAHTELALRGRHLNASKLASSVLPSAKTESSGKSRMGALAQSAAAFALKRNQQNKDKQHQVGQSNTTKSEQQVPPRLPSRLASLSSGIQASKVFPIPPPPTSPGTGPSGKANLILVSPTGLSPPLPKRKGASLQNGGNKLQHLHRASQYQVPEFSTIKHIDENGKCSLLVNNNEPPAGIPKHAKLAPPETQKHILRYLMSASRDRLVDLNRPSNYPAPMMANGQRPLPIIPRQAQAQAQKHQMRQDESSLYYCGLQARVAQGQRQLAPKYPALAFGRQYNGNQAFGQYCKPTNQWRSNLGAGPKLCSSSTCDIGQALKNLRAYGPNYGAQMIGGRNVKSPSGSLSISLDNLNSNSSVPGRKSGGSILGQMGSAFGNPFRLLTFRGPNGKAKEGGRAIH